MLGAWLAAARDLRAGPVAFSVDLVDATEQDEA
jgi:hypothetical protein